MSQQAGITAIGSYLPAAKITNTDLEKTVETTDEWITSRTGIKERRQAAAGENCSDMAAYACSKALQKARLLPQDVDLIISTSLSPDKICPSTASLIQGKLGLTRAAAFDLSAACAGFSFALATGAGFINSGMYKNVLVVGAEAISRLIDWTDRNTCILFGDGAGAAVLQSVAKPYGILGSYLANDGNKANLIQIPAGGSSMPASIQTVEQNDHFLKMQGKEVFRFAVRVIPIAINNVLAKARVGLEEVTLFIPHQANIRIIEAAAKKLNVPRNKFFTNLEYLGNTSTASVPLALEAAVNEGRLKKGDLVIIIGFGAGLSWGANVIRWGIGKGE